MYISVCPTDWIASTDTCNCFKVVPYTSEVAADRQWVQTNNLCSQITDAPDGTPQLAGELTAAEKTLVAAEVATQVS